MIRDTIKRVFSNKKAKPANVYVLRTHLLNDYIKNKFQQMQEQLGKENVFLLFDATKSIPDAPHIKWNADGGVSVGPAIITITEQDCQEINSLHNQGKWAGSFYKVEAQVYSCYVAIKREYDYLWFIEYDVYTNDFKSALSPFDHVKADMLTKGTLHKYYKWIRNPYITKRWFWWNKLDGEFSHLPKNKQRGCFFPINRFSKRFLTVLEQNLSKSSGYCEVYFPTLCHVNGLILKSMSLSAFGTFRCTPKLTQEEVNKIKPKDPRMYHPVKNIEQNP